MVPSLLRRFRAANPLVELVTHENTTRDLLEALDGHEIDLAFVRSSVARYPALRAVCLDHEAMLIALPDTHPLARQAETPISLETLAGEDFISYRRADGPGIQDALTAACERAGVPMLSAKCRD